MEIVNISKLHRNFANFSKNLQFLTVERAKVCKACRSSKTLQNEPLVAIVAVDTAENEPSKDL